MRSIKRTVIIRSLSAVVFLAVALTPYAAVFLGSQEATFLSVFVTPLFLVASEIASIRAITAGSRITSEGKRRILVWSLNVFGSALAALIMLLGSYLIASMPYCTGRLTAAGCVQNVGLPAYFCIGAFAAAIIVGLIVAPIFALSDAARTGAWIWFASILLFLLGTWAGAGSLLVPQGVSALKTLSLEDWLPIARLALPLLTPIIAILYSFADRERPKGA
ncbi:MAG: hypothetical protein ACM3N4_07980 [Nitrososphaerota archaeon]